MQQGMLALPDLEDENLYHVLHTRYASPPFHSDILYRTTVDMTLDGGLGGATEKNVPLIEDSLWAGYLTATKHANNNDWWIISAKGFTNRYYKILYSNEGFEIKGEQEIGWALDYAGAGGQAVFSPNGEKYVWYDQIRNVMLFDFDRATGEFSNPQQLHVADTIYFGGAAISPNNRFLYISNAIYLYQYDLMADDIQASQVVIDTFDGFSSPFPANFFLMQLAPDCRIYMSTGNGTDRLHVIHHPNRKGKDCGFEQHAVHLPKDNFSTIPNFPNYRLGTPYPVCDSTIQLVTSSVSVSVSLVEVKVWPNPASGQLGVELPKPLIGDGQWSLYSAMGQQVLSHKMERGSAKAAVFLEDVPNGLYFWEMTSNGERLDSGKLLIAK